MREVLTIQEDLNSRKYKEAKRSREELIEKLKLITYENYTTLDTSQSSQNQMISDIQAIIKKIEISKNNHDRKYEN